MLNETVLNLIVPADPIENEFRSLVEPSVSDTLLDNAPVRNPVSSAEFAVVVNTRACRNVVVFRAVEDLVGRVQVENFLFKLRQAALTKSIAVVVRARQVCQRVEHAGVREAHSARHHAPVAEASCVHLVQVEFVAVQAARELRPEVDQHFVVRALRPVVESVVTFACINMIVEYRTYREYSLTSRNARLHQYHLQLPKLMERKQHNPRPRVLALRQLCCFCTSSRLQFGKSRSSASPIHGIPSRREFRRHRPSPNVMAENNAQVGCSHGALRNHKELVQHLTEGFFIKLNFQSLKNLTTISLVQREVSLRALPIDPLSSRYVLSPLQLPHFTLKLHPLKPVIKSLLIAKSLW